MPLKPDLFLASWSQPPSVACASARRFETILLPLPLLEPSLSSFFAAYEMVGPKVPCMPSVADSDSIVRLVMMPELARFVRLVMADPVRLVMADPCWGPVQAVEKVGQH